MVLLLDLARGAVALWVFFFHLQNLFEVPSRFIANVASFGHSGVPMFFVISGYVITYAAESSHKAQESLQTNLSYLLGLTAAGSTMTLWTRTAK